MCSEGNSALEEREMKDGSRLAWNKEVQRKLSIGYHDQLSSACHKIYLVRRIVFSSYSCGNQNPGLAQIRRYEK